MSNSERVSGDDFKIIKTGKFSGGYWNILDADKRLIFTCPASVGQDKINKIMSSYQREQWNSYILSSRRFCVVLSDLDIDNLENKILSNISES